MTVPTGDHRFLDALNQRFAAIAGWSYDYRWVVVAFGLALVIGSTLLSWRVEIDNSYEAYFDPSDPAYQAYEQYRDDFGSDEVSYILYEAPGYEHGVWNVEVMRQIAEVTRRLEDVPFIYDVQSIVNAELIEGTPDGIDILEIEDAFPLTQEELLVYRDKVLSKPMLVGGIASEDKTHGAIIIDMDRSSTDPPEAIIHDPEKSPYDLENLYPQVTDAHIEAVLNSREYEGIRFYHAGDVPLNAVYNRLIMGEGETLELITSFVIGTILLLAFRSAIGALAPVFVVNISVTMVLAFMALMGWSAGLSFGGTPTLLTAIGVAHAVHILSEFGDNYRKLRDRREALVRTVYLVGTPCLITSLTTAIGFASMSFVPIKAIAESGVYNSFGIFMAFVMSFTLLMSLLSMGRREMAGISGVVAAGAGWSYAAGLGSGVVAIAAIAAGALALGLTLRFYDRETRVSATSVKGGEHLRRALLAIAAFDIRHRKPILAAFAVVFAISGVGITRVVADSNWLDDFSDEMPLKGITQRVDRVMGGSTNVIYLFDSGELDGIKEPAVLREMERIQEIAGRHGDFVRKSYSLVDILKDLNQAFHGGDPAYYTIPESRELVAQYLLLYEMSGGEEAEEMVTSDYQRASVELRLALAPTSKTAELVNEIEAELTDAPLEQADVSLTGIGALWIKLLDYIVSSQIQGFLLAFCAIALIMVLVFRSFGTGIISMIPNLTPVALTLGVMGWAGIFLDYNKISIASVAIGIAVDDTIHLIFRYRHEFDECGNYEEALERAMQDVGKALLITSAALVAGFLVLTLSTLDSQATYGILLATTIVTALIADFLLMPVLVLTFQPFGPEGAQKTRRETLREAA
jgi:predicted RND superfamily exporter protein